jgi:hypothetical protein
VACRDGAVDPPVEVRGHVGQPRVRFGLREVTFSDLLVEMRLRLAHQERLQLVRRLAVHLRHARERRVRRPQLRVQPPRQAVRLQDSRLDSARRANQY